MAFGHKGGKGKHRHSGGANHARRHDQSVDGGVNAGGASSGAPVAPQDGDDTPMHAESGEFFLNRYRAMDAAARLMGPKDVRQALRVNTLKTSHDLLIERLAARGAVLERIPFIKNGYHAVAKFSLGATPEYLLGHYYLQAPLSQLACEVLAPPVGATVLDMASAPGGKTTYLAMMVLGGIDHHSAAGKVVALDSDPLRLAAVRNNAERMGLPNVLCVKKDARFATDFDTKFMFVLLDAPCSGNMCSEDGWCGKRRIEDIRENARTQRELLRSAVACLAPGGRLLYSTCSLEPEEDELAIDTLLKRSADMSVVALDWLPIGDHGVTVWGGVQLDARIAGTRRFWPHKTGCEGFFMALLEKKEG
ncbi:TPA: RsmB/NOP family class I SAM-dependent RNA methyltransferase [Candidatus Woesearchaeota archaeon]|nr:RsmB/NOP family class I SAM-dependent RNA methyltransferase [Candidatus Woesearchaeota archaeon]